MADRITLHSPMNPGALYEMGDGTLLSFTEGYASMTPAQYESMVKTDPDRWAKILESGKVLVLKDGVPIRVPPPQVIVRRSEPVGGTAPAVKSAPKVEEEDPATPVMGAPVETGKVVREQSEVRKK